MSNTELLGAVVQAELELLKRSSCRKL